MEYFRDSPTNSIYIYRSLQRQLLVNGIFHSVSLTDNNWFASHKIARYITTARTPFRTYNLVLFLIFQMYCCFIQYVLYRQSTIVFNTYIWIWISAFNSLVFSIQWPWHNNWHREIVKLFICSLLKLIWETTIYFYNSYDRWVIPIAPNSMQSQITNK